MSLNIPIKPLVLVGPSGSGRSAIIYHLTSTLPWKFNRVISHTTRLPRAHEKEDINFYFTEDKWIEEHEKQFITLLRSPNKHYYGITYQEIQRVYNQNRIPIFKMTLEAYKKNVGIARLSENTEEEFPKKKSYLFLKRNQQIECNALYVQISDYQELKRRLRCSPFCKEEQTQKLEAAKREDNQAEKYFDEDDIITSSEMDQTLVNVKSRLFELY